MKTNDKRNEVVLDEAARIIKLDSSNSSFKMNNGFLTLTTTCGGEEKHYQRVFLHRDFPHELLWEYISVIGEDGREIGLIYNVIKDFDEEISKILVTEIERKYYSPTIVSILSLKERYGFSYWKVKLDNSRTVSYTMRDTFRNIIHTGEDSAILIDVDGNRYTIKSISGLDRNSYRKIELYL